MPSNEIPDFEPIPMETPADAPKKPRRKPMKRRNKSAITTPKKRASMLRVVKKARKKRRKVGVARKAAPTNGHAGGKFSDEVYRTINTLMGMKRSDLDMVLDIVKGLIA